MPLHSNVADQSAEHAPAADRFAREISALLTVFCGALAAADGHSVGPRINAVLCEAHH